MQQFIDKYREQINGVLTGFDRLVFRGSLRRLNYGCWDRGLPSLVAQGMEQYLWQNHVLFKDYLDHVKQVSRKVKQASVQPLVEQGLPVEFLRGPSADKEEIARAFAAERKLTGGLVCALSGVEPSPSFEHRGTHMVRRTKPCQALYQYQIHEQVGWMSTISAAACFNLSWIRLTVSLRLWSTHPDLVPVQHSGGTERAGMARPSNGPAGVEVPAAGQLFRLDRGL